MLNITIDSLRDFQACPLYYKFEHLDNVKNRTTQLRVTRRLFKETLISIVNYFFYKKMSWQEPSYKVLESRWEKKWIKDVSTKDLITNKTSATNAYPTDAYYTTKATSALRTFHKWFADSQAEVVLIDESFIVPLNKDVSLSGSFDCILRTARADGEGYDYQIYVWSVNLSNKSVDYWATHFAALDFAFRYRNNFASDLKVSYYLWDFTDPAPGVKQFLIDKKDHYVLKQWASSIATNHGHYYPVRGLSAYCKGCKFDKLCLKWSEAADSRE